MCGLREIRVEFYLEKKCFFIQVKVNSYSQCICLFQKKKKQLILTLIDWLIGCLDQKWMTPVVYLLHQIKEGLSRQFPEGASFINLYNVWWYPLKVKFLCVKIMMAKKCKYFSSQIAYRALDIREYSEDNSKIIFLISQWKHMLWSTR